MKTPHYVATCPNCGAQRTVTRARLETGRAMSCEPCGREMTVVNLHPKRRPPKPREVSDADA